MVETELERPCSPTGSSHRPWSSAVVAPIPCMMDFREPAGEREIAKQTKAKL